MGDNKFHLIRRVKVGTLNTSMQAEWDRLYEAQLKLLRMEEAHAEALDAFWEVLQREFSSQVPQNDVTACFRVADGGEVFVEHCACVTCQAVLHKITVTETMSQMYDSDLPPQKAIDTLEENAKRLDSYPVMRKKMPN
jgi:hypothetical protein